jgi:hypothetical protein
MSEIAKAATVAHGPDCLCTRCAGFQPGNELARRHGRWVSDVRLSQDDRVAEHAERIEETQPIGHPADAGAIWRLALCYRRVEFAAAALAEADAATEGRPMAHFAGGPVAEAVDRMKADLDRWLARASKLEAELGRTPSSRAKLGLHLAMTGRALGADLLERYGGDQS